ncbi:MAG: response regulator [Armatimonadota bacterium]
MAPQLPIVLAIDRNPRNLELMQQFLEKNGYRVVAASTLEEIDRVLLGPERIRLALVDIAGFDRAIWDRCERMRTEQIPFLVIYPHQRVGIQEKSLEHGARGMLEKPLGQKELLGLVKTLLGEE